MSQWFAESELEPAPCTECGSDNVMDAPASCKDCAELRAYLEDTCGPCECGAVRGPSGGYLVHGYGAHPDCEADQLDIP